MAHHVPGTWLLTVTPYLPNSNNPQPQHRGIITFTADGSVIERAQAVVAGGVGAWEPAHHRRDHGEFNFTLFRFVEDFDLHPPGAPPPPPPPLPALGITNFSFMQRVCSSNYFVNPDHFKGHAKIHWRESDGKTKWPPGDTFFDRADHEGIRMIVPEAPDCDFFQEWP